MRGGVHGSRNAFLKDYRNDMMCPQRRLPLSREGGSGKGLPTETKVGNGTSQSKSGAFVNFSKSGIRTNNLRTHSGS